MNSYLGDKIFEKFYQNQPIYPTVQEVHKSSEGEDSNLGRD